MSFESGTTIRIVVSVKDFSGNPTDPDDAPRVSIWDGSHVKRVDSQPMVRDGVGKYHLDATLDEGWTLGSWIYEARASIAGKPLVKRGSFRVIRTGGV